MKRIPIDPVAEVILVMIAAAFVLLGIVLWYYGTLVDECHEKGGVFVNDQCFKAELIPLDDDE